MKEREEVRRKLLKSLALDDEAQKSSYNFFINQIYQSTYETKYNKKYNKHDSSISDSLTFKASLRNRVLMTIAINLPTVAILIQGSVSGFKRENLLGSIIIIVFFGSITLYIWTSQIFKNKITLNNEGILYEGINYLWKDIVTTHIQKCANRGKDTDWFLMIGLFNEELVVCEISKINFGSFWGDSLYNYQLLGHYIEIFKSRNA